MCAHTLIELNYLIVYQQLNGLTGSVFILLDGLPVGVRLFRIIVHVRNKHILVICTGGIICMSQGAKTAQDYRAAKNEQCQFFNIFFMGGIKLLIIHKYYIAYFFTVSGQ